jgi:hypothetical protein
LLLLISVATGSDSPPGRGHKKIKRPPKTSAATAPDYSMTFGAACKDSGHIVAVLKCDWFLAIEIHLSPEYKLYGKKSINILTFL